MLTMLILKIIIISSAVLNIGHAETRCDSNQIVEFICQDPTCKLSVEDGYSEGQFYNRQKQLVTIIGYNNNTFLVRNNKGIMSIVPKNQLQVKLFAKIEHWKYTVNINKNTFEVCEQSIPNNGENIDTANVNQVNPVTDEKKDKTNNGINVPEDIEDANIKIVEEINEQYEQIINETDPIVSSYQKELIDEELDESIEIESEDELTLDTNFVDKSLQEELRIAENQVNKIVSESNDNVSNFDFVDDKKTDLNDKINQNIIPKPTIPSKLENDSSAECTLDSCAKDTYSEENNINSEKLSSTVPPINVHSAHQQKNDNPPSTQELNKLDDTDNLTIESVNDTTLQDNNNGIDNLNVEISHQQQNEPVPINKVTPNLEQTEDFVEPNNPAPQIPSTIALQNNSYNIEEVNEIQQENLNQNISQQSQSVEKTGDFVETSTNIVPQSSSTITLQNSNNIEEVNDTQPEKINVDISKQQDELSPSLEKTDDYVKEPKSLDPHNPSIIALENNGNIIKEEKKTHQEIAYDNPLKDITEEISQQSNSNYIESQLLNVNNDIKETGNNLPTKLNSHEKPESQNSQEGSISNVKSTTPNNDSVDNILTHPSPVKEIMNETNTVSSIDYQTTVSDEKVDVPDMLNTNSIDKCTSDSGCSHSMDSIPQYPYKSLQPQYKPENKVLSYENTLNNIEPSDNEKSKEFEPQSFVASFGHPDTCSGINCLKFKRNVEKTIKTPQPLNPVLKQEESVITSPTNNGLEKENNKIVNEITEQTSEELSLLDTFQNWISSPTLNSIDFLWNIIGDYSNAYNDIYPDQIVNNQKIIEHGKLVSHSELYFIVMAIVTLLFSLIYYKYQKGTYENQLLTLLAAKDQNLLILEKELSLLKEQSCGNTTSAVEKNDEIEALNEKLFKSENIISSQAIRIEKLEQEVEELTESGMEMHKLLNSALQSSSKNSGNLKALKVKLVDSENLVAALTQKNFDKTTELERKTDVLKKLQITVDELTHKNTNLVEENAKISSQLEQVIAKNMLKESKLLGEINSLKFELDKQTNALITAENEVSLSKEKMQEILTQKFTPADSKKFLSTVKLSAELKSVKQMCEGYKQKLDESLKSNQQHLDHIDVLKSEKMNIEDNILKLEKKNEESINKLHILTKFFKEQEKEYLKQINEKVILCENQEGESTDLQERINYLKQEITNYKSEIQSLKKEITDQEASFKIQISAADKKSSDHWISFRQAERKLKEMELETAQLRNKLTMVDKKLENGTKSIDSSKDFDDELLDIPLPTESPEFILLDFEPPPPILTNERLPPLGALGQASSPPVPLSRRHNRSLSPGSPPPIQRSSVFRPLPQRYNYMNRQNSLGHSAESLDK